MQLIPAIDLRDGKCVRLEQGDPDTSRVYDDDPVDRARAFVDAGARRLHVVDLGRAFGSGDDRAALQAICRAVDIPVQIGGGIREFQHAQAAFAAGAQEIIIGTILVDDEAASRCLIDKFPQRVIAAIDARGREVATHGWQVHIPIDRAEQANFGRYVICAGKPLVILRSIRIHGLGIVTVVQVHGHLSVIR